MPYRRMLISVGVFVFLVAVFLIVSLGYVIQKKGMFEKKYHYTLSAKSGSDLIEGMPILYSGFEIGVVTTLTLTDEGKVEVIIEIPKHERRWVKEDSLFILNKPLIGSATIIVESKDLSSKALKESEHKMLVTKDGINELIEKVQPVLDDIQGITSNINYLTSKKSDISRTLTHVEVITGKIAQTRAVNQLDIILADISFIVKELSESLTNKDKGLLSQVSLMLRHADEGILGKDDSSLSRINALLDDIAQKLKALDSTVSSINSASGDIKGLTGDVKFTMKKTDELLNGLNGIVGKSPSGEVSLP